MKMTWLHKFFGLFFIPADGRAKSAQQLISKVLPFHPLYFPWSWSSESDFDIESSYFIKAVMLLDTIPWEALYVADSKTG